MQYFKLIDTDLNINAEISTFDQQNNNIGAIVSFIGVVRKYNYLASNIPITHIQLDHYPIMTEKEIKKIIDLAIKNWKIKSLKIIHRIGKVMVNDPIVLILTASEHRENTYLANKFLIDFIKTEVPFWKKEFYSDGTSKWVDLNKNDLEIKSQWKI